MDTAHDREILRGLAEQWAEIAALPVHRHTVEGWKRINGLGRGKPMVWINEMPWHEMDVDGELTLRTSNEFCRAVELELRRTVYLWRHMRADMVVEPVFFCSLVIRDTGFGIDEVVDIARTDESSDVVSRHFQIQIADEQDLAKIRMPEVSYDHQATEARFERLNALIGDLLPIEKRGMPGFWFAPWDELIRWWGVEEALTDLVLRPGLVHQAMERLVGAYICRLDQYESLNLLSRNDHNVRIGSGGLGYVDELPQADFDSRHVRTVDLWGCATAQIFSDVSPEMHEEFALQYERRWLSRFGLNYYGCCEPLHRKIGILESVPNLRKISMSRWIDVDEAVRAVGDRFVFSYKPNPAPLAEHAWHPERAREELRSVLQKARGCSVEVIMKDISTVRYEPQRLWEWADIAAQVAAEFA